MSYVEQHLDVYDCEFFVEHLMLTQRKLAVLGVTAWNHCANKKANFFYLLCSSLFEQECWLCRLKLSSKSWHSLEFIVLLEPEWVRLKNRELHQLCYIFQSISLTGWNLGMPLIIFVVKRYTILTIVNLDGHLVFVTCFPSFCSNIDSKSSNYSFI